MVSFICGACQSTLKKNQVNRHCETVCRSAWVFTCVDCGKDFQGFEYDAHKSCVTEGEKYHGKFYTPKKPGQTAPANNGNGKKWPGFKAFISEKLRMKGEDGEVLSELQKEVREGYQGELTELEVQEVLAERLTHRKYRVIARGGVRYAVYHKFV